MGCGGVSINSNPTTAESHYQRDMRRTNQFVDDGAICAQDPDEEYYSSASDEGHPNGQHTTPLTGTGSSSSSSDESADPGEREGASPEVSEIVPVTPDKNSRARHPVRTPKKSRDRKRRRSSARDISKELSSADQHIDTLSDDGPGAFGMLPAVLGKSLANPANWFFRSERGDGTGGILPCFSVFIPAGVSEKREYLPPFPKAPTQKSLAQLRARRMPPTPQSEYRAHLVPTWRFRGVVTSRLRSQFSRSEDSTNSAGTRPQVHKMSIGHVGPMTMRDSIPEVVDRYAAALAKCMDGDKSYVPTRSAFMSESSGSRLAISVRVNVPGNIKSGMSAAEKDLILASPEYGDENTIPSRASHKNAPTCAFREIRITDVQKGDNPNLFRNVDFSSSGSPKVIDAELPVLRRILPSDIETGTSVVAVVNLSRIWIHRTRSNFGSVFFLRAIYVPIERHAELEPSTTACDPLPMMTPISFKRRRTD